MNYCLRLLSVILLVIAASHAAASGQQKPSDNSVKVAPTAPPILNVAGEVARPLKMTDADFAKLSRQSVRCKDHGVDALFEGVAVAEILKLAGVEFGEGLRGKRLETYLVVEAADRYRAVFALPELDPAFTDQIILLADRRDGKPLSATEGNWRIVVPNEKRAARWVRQVVSLIVKRDQP